MASFEEELAELQADLKGLLIYTEDEILDDEGLRALSWEPFEIQRVKKEISAGNLVFLPTLGGFTDHDNCKCQHRFG